MVFEGAPLLPPHPFHIVSHSLPQQGNAHSGASTMTSSTNTNLFHPHSQHGSGNEIEAQMSDNARASSFPFVVDPTPSGLEMLVACMGEERGNPTPEMYIAPPSPPSTGTSSPPSFALPSSQDTTDGPLRGMDSTSSGAVPVFPSSSSLSTSSFPISSSTILVRPTPLRREHALCTSNDAPWCPHRSLPTPPLVVDVHPHMMPRQKGDEEEDMAPHHAAHAGAWENDTIVSPNPLYTFHASTVPAAHKDASSFAFHTNFSLPSHPYGEQKEREEKDGEGKEVHRFPHYYALRPACSTPSSSSMTRMSGGTVSPHPYHIPPSRILEGGLAMSSEAVPTFSTENPLPTTPHLLTAVTLGKAEEGGALPLLSSSAQRGRLPPPSPARCPSPRILRGNISHAEASSSASSFSPRMGASPASMTTTSVPLSTPLPLSIPSPAGNELSSSRSTGGLPYPPLPSGSFRGTRRSPLPSGGGASGRREGVVEAGVPKEEPHSMHVMQTTTSSSSSTGSNSRSNSSRHYRVDESHPARSTMLSPRDAVWVSPWEVGLQRPYAPSHLEYSRRSTPRRVSEDECDDVLLGVHKPGERGAGTTGSGSGMRVGSSARGALDNSGLVHRSTSPCSVPRRRGEGDRGVGVWAPSGGGLPPPPSPLSLRERPLERNSPSLSSSSSTPATSFFSASPSPHGVSPDGVESGERTSSLSLRCPPPPSSSTALGVDSIGSALPTVMPTEVPHLASNLTSRRGSPEIPFRPVPSSSHHQDPCVGLTEEKRGETFEWPLSRALPTDHDAPGEEKNEGEEGEHAPPSTNGVVKHTAPANGVPFSICLTYAKEDACSAVQDMAEDMSPTLVVETFAGTAQGTTAISSDTESLSPLPPLLPEEEMEDMDFSLSSFSSSSISSSVLSVGTVSLLEMEKTEHEMSAKDIVDPDVGVVEEATRKERTEPHVKDRRVPSVSSLETHDTTAKETGFSLPANGGQEIKRKQESSSGVHHPSGGGSPRNGHTKHTTLEEENTQRHAPLGRRSWEAEAASLCLVPPEEPSFHSEMPAALPREESLGEVSSSSCSSSFSSMHSIPMDALKEAVERSKKRKVES